MTATANADAPTEADLLAPWRATDRLDARDAALFERLMAEDASVAGRLAVAMEERGETVSLNEALPAPSSAARERLFAMIERDEAVRSPVKASGLGRWFSEKLAGLAPSTLAWGAAAAALVITVQGAMLTRGYLGGVVAGYDLASDGTETATAGQTVMIAFAPTATADAIAALLRETRAEIVAGPKPGGVFVLKIADGKLAKAELDAAVKRFGDRTGVVRFVAPAQ